MSATRASAVLLAAVAIVAAVLVATRDRRPKVAAGTVLSAGGGIAGGRTFAVRVPPGALTVQVGPTREAVPRTPADDAQVRVAGGRFVLVSAKTDVAAPLPLARRPGWTVHRPELALVTGGRAYPLRAGRSRWVAVRGDARDVRLRVGYEGRSETLDPRTPRPTGSFAALDTVAAQAKVDQRRTACGRELWPNGFGRAEPAPAPRCVVARVERAPFVGGLGWARDGRTWLIVNADADLPLRFARGHATYAADGASDDPPPRYTLDGAKPALAYAPNDVGDIGFKDATNPDQAVFDVAAGATGQTLAVALPLDGRRRSGAGPVTTTGTLRWTVALP